MQIANQKESNTESARLARETAAVLLREPIR